MNPIHLVIAPTFLTANSDRDVGTFAQGLHLRMAKLYVRTRPGRSHAAQAYRLAYGLTGSYNRILA